MSLSTRCKHQTCIIKIASFINNRLQLSMLSHSNLNKTYFHDRIRSIHFYPITSPLTILFHFLHILFQFWITHPFEIQTVYLLEILISKPNWNGDVIKFSICQSSLKILLKSRKSETKMNEIFLRLRTRKNFFVSICIDVFFFFALVILYNKFVL